MVTQAMTTPDSVGGAEPAGLPRWPRITRNIARSVLLAWGAFWAWFITMNIVSDGPPSFVYAFPLLAGVLLAALVPLRWPRVGGAMAIAFGAYAMWRFSAGQAGVIALVAVLPMLAGLALIGAGPTRGGSRGASAARARTPA